MDKIFGFYHVCLANHWRQTVEEQVNKIVKSGLYEKTQEIFVSCVGSQQNKDELRRKFPDKFKIIFYSENVKLCEIPIFNYMQNLSKKENFIIWYIHTKGVFSAVNNPNVTEWRKMMEYFIIQRHENCIKTICSSKCDMCGIYVYDAYMNPSVKCSVNSGHFFAGNFWWSKSDFIKKLPNVMEIFNRDRNNRWLVEFFFARFKWVRFYSFYQRQINVITDLYHSSLKREHYINTNYFIKIPYQKPKLKLL